MQPEQRWRATLSSSTRFKQLKHIRIRSFLSVAMQLKRFPRSQRNHVTRFGPCNDKVWLLGQAHKPYVFCAAVYGGCRGLVAKLLFTYGKVAQRQQTELQTNLLLRKNKSVKLFPRLCVALSVMYALEPFCSKCASH